MFCDKRNPFYDHFFFMIISFYDHFYYRYWISIIDIGRSLLGKSIAAAAMRSWRLQSNLVRLERYYIGESMMR